MRKKHKMLWLVLFGDVIRHTLAQVAVTNVCWNQKPLRFSKLVTIVSVKQGRHWWWQKSHEPWMWWELCLLFHNPIVHWKTTNDGCHTGVMHGDNGQNPLRKNRTCMGIGRRVDDETNITTCLYTCDVITNRNRYPYIILQDHTISWGLPCTPGVPYGTVWLSSHAQNLPTYYMPIQQ